MKNYRTLPTQAADFTFDFEHHDSFSKGDIIDLNSPARTVVVDIERDKPRLLSANMKVDGAVKMLREQSIRFAIVTDSSSHPVGLIGLNDLQSAKVMSFAGKMNIPRQEVSLSNLMVPLESIRVITQNVVDQAVVGELVTTLEHSHSPYLMITDNQHLHYTGIVFARRIERMVNFPVTISPTADNLADMVNAIG